MPCSERMKPRLGTERCAGSSVAATAVAVSSSVVACSRTSTRACRSTSKPLSARMTPWLGPERRAGSLVAAVAAAAVSSAAMLVQYPRPPVCSARTGGAPPQLVSGG
eukprot:4639439-Heterocapsa_arctica.AAC.1